MSPSHSAGKSSCTTAAAPTALCYGSCQQRAVAFASFESFVREAACEPAGRRLGLRLRPLPASCAADACGAHAHKLCCSASETCVANPCPDGVIGCTPDTLSTTLAAQSAGMLHMLHVLTSFAGSVCRRARWTTRKCTLRWCAVVSDCPAPASAHSQLAVRHASLQHPAPAGLQAPL